MAEITIKRTGSWIVELVRPVQYKRKLIKHIEISRPPLSATIRWGREEIPSSLALFSEMCGLPEEALLMITEDDMPNVLMAFLHLTPPTIKTGMDSGTRPLATPKPFEELDTSLDETLPEPVAEPELPTEPEPEPELPPQPPADPRFPVIDDMPVRAFSKPPRVNIPDDKKKKTFEDAGGIDFDIPGETMKAVI